MGGRGNMIDDSQLCEGVFIRGKWITACGQGRGGGLGCRGKPHQAVLGDKDYDDGKHIAICISVVLILRL